MSEEATNKEELLSKTKTEIWAMNLPELSSYVRDLRDLYRMQKAGRDRSGMSFNLELEMKRCFALLSMSAKRLSKITD